MEETRPKKKRRLWWLLLPAAVLVLAALAVVFFLGNSGLSARYDNGDAIRAAYDNGVLTLTLPKKVEEEQKTFDIVVE